MKAKSPSKKTVRGRKGSNAPTRAVQSRRTPPNNPYKPWKAVTLSVDPSYSGTIGVSIFVTGRHFMSGTIEHTRNKHNEINHWVDCAHAKAIGLGLPLLVFIEGWGNMKRSIKSSVSLGSSRGWWEQKVRTLMLPHSTLGVNEIPIIIIEWSEWTRGLFGQFSGDAKGKSIVMATSIAMNELEKGEAPDHNRAEAICINYFGSRWDGVKIKGLERCK